MSLAMMATATAGTKRAVVTNGKRGLPQAYLSGLACTPVMPAGAETMQRLKLDSLFQMFTVILPGQVDIVESDLLTMNGQDYVVRNVDGWTVPVSNEHFTNVTLEKLVNADR